MNVNNQMKFSIDLYNRLIKNVSEQIVNNELKQNTSISVSFEENLQLILSSMGQSLSEENINMIKFLMSNELSITKENLQFLSMCLKIFDEKPLEKALIFIKNNIRPTKDMAEQLEGYISKNIRLDKQVEELITNIGSIDLSNEDLDMIFNNKNINFNFKQINENILNIKIEILSIFSKRPELFKNIISNKNINFLEIFGENFEKLNNSQKLNNILEKIFPENIIFNKEKISNIIKNLMNYQKENNLEEISIKNNIENKISINNTLNDKNNINILEKEIFNILNKSPENNNKLNFLFSEIYKFQKNIKDKFSFDFKDSNVEDLNEFFNNIKNIAHKFKNTLENFTEDKANLDILKNIDNINKNIDFMLAMKESMFFQIPLNINNFSTNAELYIFKDKKKVKKKDEESSALLSLDLAYLGHLEAYINKIGRGISCQFRLENKNTEKVIKENIRLLEDYLEYKNFILKDITFKDINDSFSLISNNEEIISQFSKKDFKISSFNAQA